MQWTLRLFGFPILELAAVEPDLSGWGHLTGGQFEIAQEPAEPDYEYSEEEFGFRAGQ